MQEAKKRRSRARKPETCKSDDGHACKHKAPPGYYSPADIAIPCDDHKECVQYAQDVLAETIVFLRDMVE